jgi:SAM-dependent methyltransferase
LKTADALGTFASLSLLPEFALVASVNITQDFSLSRALTESFSGAFLAAIGPSGFLRSPLRVLDVGTGTARIPIEICRRRRGIKMTAVDRGIGILRRAQCRVARAGLEDVVRIDQADAGALPYAGGAFDAVISNGLVHHVADRTAVLREMVRVLRPGGMLFVRDSLPRSDAETIAGILQRSCRDRDALLRSNFRSRFQGALTMTETRILVSAAGLPIEWLRPIGPRHWLLAGRVGRGR